MFNGIVFRSVIGLSLGALVLMGCESDPSVPDYKNTPTGEPFPWLKVTDPNYGMFYVTAQSNANQPPRYHSGGVLFTTTAQNQSASGGTMTASGMSITPTGDEYYSIGRPVFGATATWGLSGNPAAGIPPFTDNLYVPDEIVMSAPLSPGADISKTSGVTVQWNPDPNNTIVVIWYEYDYVMSQIINPALPNATVNKFWVVPDNGSYTIPGSEFTAVPNGGYGRLTIGRGNAKLTGTATHKFHVYGATTAVGVFKVMP